MIIDMENDEDYEYICAQRCLLNQVWFNMWVKMIQSDNDLLFSDDFDEIVEDMLMLNYFL